MPISLAAFLSVLPLPFTLVCLTLETSNPSDGLGIVDLARLDAL